jgi:hypothetical protein
MQRQLFLAGLIVIGASALASQSGAQASLDAVLTSCEKKMQVYGRDEKGGVVKVGETLDSYCRGFLEGMLAVLASTRTICIKDKNTSPDFLLSTVLTYRSERKVSDNDSASVIEAAFKRAFTCTDAAPKLNDPLGIS